MTETFVLITRSLSDPTSPPLVSTWATVVTANVVEVTSVVVVVVVAAATSAIAIVTTVTVILVAMIVGIHTAVTTGTATATGVMTVIAVIVVAVAEAPSTPLVRGGIPEAPALVLVAGGALRLVPAVMSLHPTSGEEEECQLEDIEALKVSKKMSKMKMNNLLARASVEDEEKMKTDPIGSSNILQAVFYFFWCKSSSWHGANIFEDSKILRRLHCLCSIFSRAQVSSTSKNERLYFLNLQLCVRKRFPQFSNSNILAQTHH